MIKTWLSGMGRAGIGRWVEDWIDVMTMRNMNNSVLRLKTRGDKFQTTDPNIVTN